MYPRPFQLKIIAKDPDKIGSFLYQYKYIQGQEWREYIGLYNEMVTNPEQAQSYSLLIVNQLFPKSVQSKPPLCIGIKEQNGEMTSWIKDEPSDELLTIDPAINHGVLWCDFQSLPQ
jgi:hypothetical protein